MPAFIVSNQQQNPLSAQNLAAAYKTILAINATTGLGTLRRGWLMEWEIGADAVPNSTDTPISWSIDVMTAAGVPSVNGTLTVQPNDIGGGDASAQLSYFANYTTEPTVTAASNLWYMGLNQRASYRIQMRDEWSAIVVPAVNLKGPAMRAKSPNYAATVGWRGLVREKRTNGDGNWILGRNRPRRR